MMRLTVIFMLSFLLSANGWTQERIKFPVGVSSKVLGFGYIWAAAKRGYFEREGLDVELILIRGTAQGLQALIAGSINVAVVAVDGPIAIAEQGFDVAMVASGSRVTHMIMGGRGYKNYEDLRGATVGSSSLTSGTAFLLRRVLKSKGLEYPRDYKLLNVGGTASSVAALSSGQIAASILSVPYSFQAQESGFNLIGRVADVFPKYLLSAYAVRRGWAEKNRPAVVKFLKALLLGKKWFEQDRKAATEFLAKEFQLKPHLAQQGLDYYLDTAAWHPELEIEMEGLKTVLDIYAEQTNMKGPIPSPQKFVDTSYLRQALKELRL